MNTKTKWTGVALLIIGLSWGVAQIGRTDESRPAIDTCGSKGAKVVRLQNGVACFERGVVVAMRGGR